MSHDEDLLYCFPPSSQAFTSIFAPILPRYPYSISLLPPIPLSEFLSPNGLDATSPASTQKADGGQDGPAQDEASLAAAPAAAGTSGDSEIRLSPAKPEPDQKKTKRVKRRRGPRRTRLGPSPNEPETKDDTQRLDEKSADSAGEGGRAAKHLEPAGPAPPAPAGSSDSGAASQAIMSALACRNVVAAAAVIAAIGATLAAGWVGRSGYLKGAMDGGMRLKGGEMGTNADMC